MTNFTLEVHSIINIHGKKWIVINNHKFKKVRFTRRGGVLWRCTKNKYCPTKVYTSNLEDNIVTFANLKHDHSHNHIFAIQASEKRETIDDFEKRSTPSSAPEEDLAKNIEGAGAKKSMSNLNQVVLNIKKEPETINEDKVDTKFSSSDSALKSLMSLSEIIFPYMIAKNKVEIVSRTGVFISESGLEFVKKKLKNDQVSLIRNLLRHLIGPQNLRYLNLIGDVESGTISMPHKVYVALQLFVTQNCSPESHLSLNGFIECIKDTFDNARNHAKFAKSIPKSTNYDSVDISNNKYTVNNFRNGRKRRRLSTGEFYSSDDQTDSDCAPPHSKKYKRSVRSEYYSPSSFYSPSNQGRKKNKTTKNKYNKKNKNK